MNPLHRIPRSVRIGSVIVATGLALGACGSSTSNGSPTSSSTAPGGGSSQVLPVTTNPITNTSTAQTLNIDSVLVENNVDPATGKTGSDHLEIALKNTGATTLSGFEIFYTFTDRTTKASESYDAKLPSSFTIAPGKTRVAHFDDTGLTDHFPVNKFSLYATSKNALDVKVIVSADGAAVQTATIKKDKGGPEQAD